MLIVQDSKYNPAVLGLREGARARRPASTVEHRHDDGAHQLGREPARLQHLGSYAALRMPRRTRRIGVVLPKDYTLVMSRVMFIVQAAKNPNAAKLWLDYILSKRGQTIIANQSELFSIRSDVEGE
jgi:iron(III) transport system substrate-binding protein